MASLKIDLLENWPPLNLWGLENWPPSNLLMIMVKSKIDGINDHKQFIALHDLTKKRVNNTNVLKCKKCISLIKKNVLHYMTRHQVSFKSLIYKS